jgi:hypothetical protein
MTYATSNPPFLIAQGLTADGNALWGYRSEDDAATVNSAGYFSNGLALGMKVGDLVAVTDTNASPPVTILMAVNAVSLTGTDVQDTATASTDTD